MYRFCFLFVFLLTYVICNKNAICTLITPTLVTESKLRQQPKPYIGGGFTFSSIAVGKQEYFSSQYGNELIQFRNLTLHTGLRLNGLFGVEFLYTRPHKVINDQAGLSYDFTGDLVAIRGMLYPLTLDWGPFSTELYFSMGLSYIANMSSYAIVNNSRIYDTLNSTANILYGAGLQLEFMKYISFRFDCYAISPLNGLSFGGPYGNVMLFYNFTVSYSPF